MLALFLALAASPDTGVWIPNRVYQSQHKRFSDFETLAAEAARADVVLLGEQHDDPDTHRIELALLEAVARRRHDVVLSLEMFERDVQPVLDRYLAGSSAEGEFLSQARPWPRYASDYRPLVEFARTHHWPVIAANVPRPMAAAVARQGLSAVGALTDSTRQWAAGEFSCPPDDYHRRFVEAMGDHPMGQGVAPADASAMVERMYQAQCVKDETMAESIVRAHGNGSGPLVIQYNGDFHSDFGEGTAQRVRRRLPHATVMVISVVPVASLDSLDPKRDRKRGDWLVFVLKGGQKS